MNCSTFEEKLHLLADPSSPEILHRAARAHAASCERCRRLLEIVLGEREPEPFGREAGDALAASILAGTSGSVCDSLDARLCAWVDDELPEADGTLLREHLDRCPSCSATASTLRELREVLPLLAEIPPDPTFVRDVLERTVRAGSDRPVRLTWFGRLWSGLFQRPRIAQEIAYVAAMLLLLLRAAHFGMGAPVVPRSAPGEPEKAPSVTAGLSDGAEALARLGVRIGCALGDLAESRPAGELHSRADGAMTAWTRLRASWSWLAHDVRRAVAALIRLDGTEIRRALAECRDRVRSTWESTNPTEPSAAPVRNAFQTDRPEDAGRSEEGLSDDHGSRGVETE
jgi:hypothetical protein